MENKKLSRQDLRPVALEDHTIPSTLQDSNYDELTFLAATVCKVPVAYLSIIKNDDAWIKSIYGSLNPAFDGHSFVQAARVSNTLLFSTTLAEKPHLFTQPTAPHYKFYAAVLLKDQHNQDIGILNILDTEEKVLTATQIKGLKSLANQFLKLIEFEKQNYLFQQIQDKLKQKYEDLEKFASHVSHDIKSPLANIISLTQLLREENQGKFDEDSTQYLDYLVESSYSLRNYVDGILDFYRSDHILEKDYEDVDLHQMLEEIAKLYEVSSDIIINYPAAAILKNVNKAALTQVFLNLISNGLKYNKKEVRRIDIHFKEDKKYYQFEVRDNGEGFPQEESSRIFDLFTTLDINDREGNPGSGIGLATVKKLVTSMGGRIKVSSNPGAGSNFTFSIKRY